MRCYLAARRLTPAIPPLLPHPLLISAAPALFVWLVVASIKARLKCKPRLDLNIRFLISALFNPAILLHKVSVCHAQELLLAGRYAPAVARRLPGRSKGESLGYRICRVAVMLYRIALTTRVLSLGPPRPPRSAPAGYLWFGRTASFHSFLCRPAKRSGMRTQ